MKGAIFLISLCGFRIGNSLEVERRGRVEKRLGRV